MHSCPIEINEISLWVSSRTAIFKKHSLHLKLQWQLSWRRYHICSVYIAALVLSKHDSPSTDTCSCGKILWSLVINKYAITMPLWHHKMDTCNGSWTTLQAHQISVQCGQQTQSYSTPVCQFPLQWNRRGLYWNWFMVRDLKVQRVFSSAVWSAATGDSRSYCPLILASSILFSQQTQTTSLWGSQEQALRISINKMLFQSIHTIALMLPCLPFACLRQATPTGRGKLNEDIPPETSGRPRQTLQRLLAK